MTIICPHCKPDYGAGAGRSRVVETRTVIARTRLRGPRRATRTVQRIRECLACCYRWRTREVTMPNRRKCK